MLGCLHKQQLTVKNEGSVAVTLSLSTSAPYKIVSVLPTLSPGQSGQVTVRFDPSESGSFTGTVQVGITGGQGSVSSSPLVGVAHKIEIQPAELAFPVILVGDVQEEKLTIKNRGVTTPTISISTNAPFSIVSLSSFALAPQESYEVKVRFSATAVGAYAASVRLAIGTVSKEIVVKGAAQTQEWFDQREQEYWENLVASYNAACGTGTAPALYAPRTAESDALLYDLCGLTLEQLRELIEWEGAEPVIELDQIVRPPDWWMPSEALKGFKSALEAYGNGNLDALYGRISRLLTPGEAVFNPHFQWLYNYIANHPNTSSLINMAIGVLQQYLNLPRGLSAFLTVLRTILLAPPAAQGGLNEVDKLFGAIVIIMSQYPEAINSVDAILTRIKTDNLHPTTALTAIVTVGGLTDVPEVSNQGLTPELYKMFLSRLAQIGDPRVRKFLSQFFEYFMKALNSPTLLYGLQDGVPYPIEGSPEHYANMVAGFITAIDVLIRGTLEIIRAPAASIVTLTLGGFPVSSAAFVHLVAVGTITLSDGTARNVTVFIHSEALLVKAETAQIADRIVNLIADLKNYPLVNELTNPTRIIVVIAYSTEEGAVQQLKGELESRPGISLPVIIISKGPDGNTVAICAGAGCQSIDDPNTPENEAQLLANAIARAMGYPPGQPFPTEPPSNSPLFTGLTKRDIKRIIWECYAWYAEDPSDPVSVWRCVCQRLSMKFRLF